MLVKFLLAPEGGNDGGSAPDEAGNASGSGTESEEPESGVSFEDFLAQAENRAEFDRRVNSSVQSALAKQAARLKAVYDEKLDEQERLSKMTAAEKQEYLTQKQAREIAEREAAITRRELAAAAKEKLASEKMPLELADLLVYTDQNACDASFERLKSTFSAALSQAVEDRVKGGKPPKDAGTEGVHADDKERARDAFRKALQGRY